MPETGDLKSRAMDEQNTKIAANDPSSTLGKSIGETVIINAERTPNTETIEKPVRIASDAMLTELANRKLRIYLEKYPLKEISALNPDIQEPILLEALTEMLKDEADNELYALPPIIESSDYMFAQPEAPAKSILDSRLEYARSLGLDPSVLRLARKDFLELRLAPYVRLSISNNLIELYQKRQITAQSYPSNKSQEVSWFSDNPAVATVRDDNIYTVSHPLLGVIHLIKPPGSYAGEGLIETHSVGTATISAQNEETGAVAACTITVQIFPKSITIFPSYIYFCSTVLITTQLTANVLPQNTTDKSVTWISTRPEIYSVSDTGLVKLLDYMAAYGISVPIIVRTNVGGVSATIDAVTGPN